MTKEIDNILNQTKELVFNKCNLSISHIEIEKESTEYGALKFELNKLRIIFREAKITPTKIGQFVTFWKRINQGPIQPFDSSDDFDLFVVNTKTDNHFGQFIFTKEILIKQGIITHNNKEGKRAIRVYPPWDIAINKQAQKTQKWQLNCFLEIPLDKNIDVEKAKKLYLKSDFI
jgi:hypothetical protein